jgi:hypothetical protein
MPGRSGGPRPGAGRPKGTTVRRKKVVPGPRSSVVKRSTVEEELAGDLRIFARMTVDYAIRTMESGDPADRLALVKIAMARLSRSLVDEETDEFGELRQEWRSMMGGLVAGRPGNVVALPERVEVDEDDG